MDWLPFSHVFHGAGNRRRFVQLGFNLPVVSRGLKWPPRAGSLRLRMQGMQVWLHLDLEKKAGFKSRSIGTPVVGSKTFKIELPLSDRRPDEAPRQRLGRYFKSVICIEDQSLYHIPPIHINRGWISRDAAKQI